jgi:transposase InsO family protein
MFHIDQGNEFKNQVIKEALETFNINRLLSMKGCPHDNAVAEAAFKIIKTEFAHPMTFNSLEHFTIGV